MKEAGQTRKGSRRVQSEIFVKSTLEDDYLNLVEDYDEDQKAENIMKNQTIERINQRICDEFSSFVDERDR